MNRDIADFAKHARGNGWSVEDRSDGYTEFRDPSGTLIHIYPATPSRPNRRIADLKNALKRAGLAWPPPSKKEQRSQRRKEGTP